MRKLSCSACGSNDLIKEGPFFVCEYCASNFIADDILATIKNDIVHNNHTPADNLPQEDVPPHNDTSETDDDTSTEDEPTLPQAEDENELPSKKKQVFLVCVGLLALLIIIITRTGAHTATSTRLFIQGEIIAEDFAFFRIEANFQGSYIGRFGERAFTEGTYTAHLLRYGSRTSYRTPRSITVPRTSHHEPTSTASDVLLAYSENQPTFRRDARRLREIVYTTEHGTLIFRIENETDGVISISMIHPDIIALEKDILLALDNEHVQIVDIGIYRTNIFLNIDIDMAYFNMEYPEENFRALIGQVKDIFMEKEQDVASLTLWLVDANGLLVQTISWQYRRDGFDSFRITLVDETETVIDTRTAPL